MLKKFTSLCLAFLLCSVYLEAQESKIKILSFDGGGVRGAASVEILKKLQSDTGVDFHRDFDVFAGTSTGSIIAVCLACGIDVHDILKDYEELSANVFSDKDMFHLFCAEYSQETLKENILQVLKSYGYEKNASLSDLPKKVVIPTVKLDDKGTGRWRLKLLENLTVEGGKVKIIDAILESTAAPTYFPSVKGYVDGGVGVNDPSFAAVMEAYIPGKNTLQDFLVLSVGTGYDQNEVSGNEDWGLWQWFTNSAGEGTPPILAMIMDVGKQLPEQACFKLLGDSYKKIDFPLLKPFPLDDYKHLSDLITYTNTYLKSHVNEWNALCEWISTNITSDR